MRDREQSTAATPAPGSSPPVPPPTPPAECDGFRETWLRHFTRPEDTAALRHASRLLFELVLDLAPHLPIPAESATRRELAAAGRDLRHLAAFLAAVAAERVTCELSEDDERLSELAERIAATVERAAFEIEAELAGVRA